MIRKLIRMSAGVSMNRLTARPGLSAKTLKLSVYGRKFMAPVMAMHFLMLLLISGAMAVLPMRASAQSDWPNRPLRIVVPSPPAGPADAMMRALAPRLSAALGQPVLIDSKPGGNSIVAAELVAKGPADGYTLLFAFESTLSINPFVYAKLPYDPIKDFVPIALVTSVVECLMVNSAVPATSVADLVKNLKAAPGSMNYASLGSGSNSHLDAERFKLATGTSIVHIPYKGASDATLALLANDVQILFAAPAQALQYINTGRLKALACLTDKPQPYLPGVQTIVAAGYPDLQMKPWLGIVMRSGTPKVAVDRLSAEISKIVASKDYQDQILMNVGFEPYLGGPTEFAELLRSDKEKFSKIVRAVNLKPE